MEKAALKPSDLWWGIPLSLTVANFFSAKVWGYPFLYCTLGSLCVELYMSWAVISLYLLSVYTAYMLWRLNLAKASIGIALIAAIFELPRLADAVFRVGGSCV